MYVSRALKCCSQNASDTSQTNHSSRRRHDKTHPHPVHRQLQHVLVQRRALRALVGKEVKAHRWEIHSQMYIEFHSETGHVILSAPPMPMVLTKIKLEKMGCKSVGESVESERKIDRGDYNTLETAMQKVFLQLSKVSSLFVYLVSLFNLAFY